MRGKNPRTMAQSGKLPLTKERRTHYDARSTQAIKREDGKRNDSQHITVKTLVM